MSQEKDLLPMELPLMSLQGGSRAKTCLPQAQGPAYLVNGQDCGEKSYALWATFSQDLCSLKMLQGCLLEMGEDGLTDFSQTWPRSGMTCNGSVYQRPNWAHRISGNEFTGLPTPVKMDGYAYSLKQTLRSQETWQTISGLTGVLVAWVIGLTGREKLKGKKYLVNPLLLERMMGYPDGWTEIAPSETPSSLKSPK